MSEHIMVDVETLGTRAGCAILSIGAVSFNKNGLGDTFYRRIRNPTGSIEAATVLWWLGNSEIARQSVISGDSELHIVALYDFYAWFIEERGKYLWCHGATFDEPIIRYATGMENIDPPWKFWDVRCTRTLYQLSGIKPTRDKDKSHNALDDAKSQAKAAVASLDKLGWF